MLFYCLKDLSLQNEFDTFFPKQFSRNRIRYHINIGTPTIGQTTGPLAEATYFHTRGLKTEKRDKERSSVVSALGLL